MFTYQYAQPDAYHFSLDSIQLAEFVAERLQLRAGLSELRTLDLCAGCGVVGFELSWYAKELKLFDFIEVQDVYADFFYKNLALVNRPELDVRWHLLNYESLLAPAWKNKFDLIVSNPPYFQRGQGMLSPSDFKNRCRFFLDSSFANFVLALANCLAPGGHAYFLLRPLKQHGCDLFLEVQSLLQDTKINAQKITTIRGTDVVFLENLEFKDL